MVDDCCLDLSIWTRLLAVDISLGRHRAAVVSLWDRDRYFMSISWLCTESRDEWLEQPHRILPKDGSLTLPPASPRPATGLLYDQPANCCCIVSDNIGPSTYESLGISDVNSLSKLAVSLASACTRLAKLLIRTHLNTYHIRFEAWFILALQQLPPINIGEEVMCFDLGCTAGA